MQRLQNSRPPGHVLKNPKKSGAYQAQSASPVLPCWLNFRFRNPPPCWQDSGRRTGNLYPKSQSAFYLDGDAGGVLTTRNDFHVCAETVEIIGAFGLKPNNPQELADDELNAGRVGWRDCARARSEKFDALKVKGVRPIFMMTFFARVAAK